MEKYAIVDVAGQQCKVTTGARILVPKLDVEVGNSVSMEVLFISDGEKFIVGTPYVKDKAVQAEVVRHGRGDKIIVFKKKKRKNYRRTRGHRQDFTEIRIKALPQ